MMEQKREKLEYLTELRAFACIAIVFLHTFYAANAYAAEFSQRVTDLCVRNLMMWAVPCFVMISGSLLLNASRTITYSKLFKKYIWRMIAVLLLFSVAFQIMDTAVAGEAFGVSVIMTGLKNALFGSGWKHMWYIYLMIGIYLLLPFYRKIASALDKKDAYYLLAVYLVFLSVLPMVETITEKKTAFYICVYSVYALYLFLGYALVSGLVTIPRWLSAVFASVGTLGVAMMTFFGEKLQIEAISDLLSSYGFPLILIQSVGIFELMRTKKAKTPRFISIILEQIDYCSFGIYLLHMAFLKALFVYLSWNPYEHGGTPMVLLIAVAVTIVTFAVIRLLKMIPGLKNIL